MRLQYKICCFLILLVGSFAVTGYKKYTTDALPQYYLTTLHNTQEVLLKLESQISKKANRQELQKIFLQLRITYKKAAVFTDYFNPYETKLVNAPALQRPFDDNYKKIITPEGLQLIEELIFTPTKYIDYTTLASTTKKIRTIYESLMQEQQIDYKLRQELVWEAIQTSLIRIVTLGITGYDSPIALHALPESKATLESIKKVISFYEKEIDPVRYIQLNSLLNKCISTIPLNQNFNQFDRLLFIKNTFNPLYKLWQEIRIEKGYHEISNRRALNIYSTSLFDTATFNINFFSPNERFQITSQRIALGKKLFFDPILSSTKNRSCGTCHKPELAFSDGLKTAQSVTGNTYLLRNTPTLWNAAFQTKFFYDSRASTLENQISDVVHNEEEMSGSLKASIPILTNDSTYYKMFIIAYAEQNEKINAYTISNALGSYIRSLVSFNSRFDLYMRGQQTILTNNEKNGFNLFMGKAKCGTCHFMPLFNGVIPPDFTDTESEVLGVPSSNKKPYKIDADKGRFNFTKSFIHENAFKTPSLRNIEITAPYMHNGVFKTLEEVVGFYNKGGGYGLQISLPNQTLPKERLHLSKNEMKNIIAFMKTLSN
jgi:cytochrome c peroxidase